MKTQKSTLNTLNSLLISQAAGAQINLPSISYCNLLFSNQTCSNNTPITINVNYFSKRFLSLSNFILVCCITITNSW
jgi:hypothetical protein